MIDYEQQNTEEWQGKKEEAKNVAIKETIKNVNNYISYCEDFVDDDSDDSEDSDDPYSSKQSYGNEEDKYQARFIISFFEALTYNYVFYSGFFINQGNDICYCPCSRKVSSKWMNMFQIELQDGCSDKCKKGELRTPQALVDHLNSVGNLNTTSGFLHRGVATYLKHLHTDKW